MRCEHVSSGESGASVWRLSGSSSPDRYLKLGTGSHAEAIRQEILRTAWLHSRGANVPAICRSIVQADFAAMLAAARPGEPLDSGVPPPDLVIEVLARELCRLHSLPAASCPFDERIPVRLERAERAIAEGQIDPAQFERRNSKMTAEALFRRLIAEVPPAEDLVVIHGDATFANILIDELGQIGFVDCGHSGRADRYLDLALVAAEIEQRYGPEWTPAFYTSYGLSTWDTRKAEFFLDLYEFF